MTHPESMYPSRRAKICIFFHYFSSPMAVCSQLSKDPELRQMKSRELSGFCLKKKNKKNPQSFLVF